MRTDGRTDGQTDITKLIVTFRNSAKAPKKPQLGELKTPKRKYYVHHIKALKVAVLQVLNKPKSLNLKKSFIGFTSIQ